MQTLETLHGPLPLPAFLPDATLGVVRAVDATDLEQVGAPALVMNVFHLMQKPGSSTIQALGGLHRMAGWTRPILTDSGGFQAYSLIRQNPRTGHLTDRGMAFLPEGASRKFLLTPEKCIQLQMAYGADILVCLDDCTHAEAPYAEQEDSVARTVGWAKRCKEEFLRQLERRKIGGGQTRPLLFAVVQGGGSAELRRRCAETLLEIGFDGYGYGGWPLDRHGGLLREMLARTRALIPSVFPMHALGVGHPQNVRDCAQMGYALFDSALPTRDARSGRLYVFKTAPSDLRARPPEEWHDTLYIDDDRYVKANYPLSPHCDCLACRRYSVAYLRHLRKCGDTLFFRLATLHNLRFMMQWMEALREER